MTCASCARAVEKAIQKLPGTIEVTVNPASEKARIVYNPDETRISALKQVIEKADTRHLKSRQKNR